MKLDYENWSYDVFEGFYESMLFNSDTLYDYNKELPKGYEWDIDFEGYKEEVSQEYTSLLQDELYWNNRIKVEYKGLDSPHYYNFTTDKIILSVNVDLRWLNAYCFKRQKEKFDAYLNKNWSDRSGFWSFIPNSLMKFKNEYKNCSKYRKEELIQIMLEFYFLQEVDFESLRLNLYESLYEILAKYKFIIDKQGNKYTNYYWNDDKSVYEIA